MKKTLCSLIVSFILLTLSNAVLAHAFPDHAEPKVGSEIGQSPKEVKVWFTQHIEPAFSKLEVFDADGKQVDNKDSRVDSTEKGLLIVTLPQLSPGTYKVSWKVVSVDTHRTHGDFKFTVK